LDRVAAYSYFTLNPFKHPMAFPVSTLLMDSPSLRDVLSSSDPSDHSSWLDSISLELYYLLAKSTFCTVPRSVIFSDKKEIVGTT
jgi:hypothetical protein